MDHELIQAMPRWLLAAIVILYGALIGVFALWDDLTLFPKRENFVSWLVWLFLVLSHAAFALLLIFMAISFLFLILYDPLGTLERMFSLETWSE